MSEIKIVSSVDSPYILREEVKQIVREAKDHILIAAPYSDRNFWSFLGDHAQKGIDIGLVVGTDKDYQMRDWVIDAMNYFEGLSQRMGWNIDGPYCVPRLHYKMLIGHDKGICGSLNPTGAAINYNLEIGLVVQGSYVEILRDIYQHTVKLPRAWEWNKLKDYHGYPPSRVTKFERIRKCIFMMYDGNGGRSIHKAVLKNMVVRATGESEHDVIRVINRMLYVTHELYSPNNNDFVCPV